MKKVFSISSLTLFVFASSCVEDVLINVKPAEEKMVVSSLFIPDSLLIVTASRSFSALSTEDLEGLEEDFVSTLLIDRGLVTINSSAGLDTLTQLAPGVFAVWLETPMAHEEFELYIYDSLTQTSVNSHTELKQQIRLDSVAVEYTIEGADSTALAYYQFLDPKENENWYLVQAFELPDLPGLEEVTIDMETGEITFEADTSNQVFFDLDREPLFQKLISDLTLENDTVKGSQSIPWDADSIVFAVFNIDEGYYDFIQARRRSGNLLSSLTREPVNHPTNIQNGYGYFTMHIPHFVAYLKEEE